MDTTAKPQAAGLSPQLTEVFRRLILAAMKVLYASPEATQSVLAIVKQAGDPVQGIAHATDMIVKRIQSQAKGLPPGVIQRVALPVASLIAEIAIASGLVKDDPSLMPKVAQVLSGVQGAPAQQQPAPAAAAPAAVPNDGEAQ
jgi:hypothetical protein